MPNPENIAGQGFHTHPERINKKGNYKHTKPLSALLRRALKATVKGENGEQIEKRVVMTAKLVDRACKGDLVAIKEIFDRIEGKATQPIEQQTITKLGDIDLSKLTDEQLEHLASIRSALGIGQEDNGGVR